jgi:hypothetical protein
VKGEALVKVLPGDTLIDRWCGKLPFRAVEQLCKTAEILDPSLLLLIAI